MAQPTLTIDLDALASNWRALDAESAPGTETAAVVKADGYGLGIARVARRLAQTGARRFFVASAEEGAEVRSALGPGPAINVFSGHLAGDADTIAAADLIPMLNNPAQVDRHRTALPGAPFGIQLDTGMNRLGMEADEWSAVRGDLPDTPALVISHLACADEPEHPQNVQQLAAFREMTAGSDAPRSFAATGGILLGPDFHFDITRPGIGLYGGLPFSAARPVLTLDIPVIQCRDLHLGETVGYGASWQAQTPARIATVAAGYADGLIRAMSGKATLYAGDTPCMLAGRVSMDMLTVDITHLDSDPESLSILCPHQGIDALADVAGTIGYEILTSLGGRYDRTYLG